MGRVVPAKAFVAAARRTQQSGGRVVFTNGVFDLLHYGHVAYLERARKLGDALFVAVNSDLSVRRLKGPSRPLVPARDRTRVLAALACVDFVTTFGDDTPARLIGRVRPDVLVKGADYRLDAIVGADEVRARGGRVVRVPLLPGRSTSALVGRISRKR
jgi:D-beta-D-heptose 7-phosphate kinase/D-beta-D-heptose 1-phosphate adenosyltransferase